MPLDPDAADQAQGGPLVEVAERQRGGLPAALLTATGNTSDDLELLEQLSGALELVER